MLIIVEVRVEDVSIAFALAWKFRCAVIRSTSSDVKSTLALSLAPARIVPNPAPPGSPSVGAPDSLDSRRLSHLTDVTRWVSKKWTIRSFLEVLGTVRVRRRHQTIVGDIYRDKGPVWLAVLALRVDREVPRELGRSGVVDIDVEGITRATDHDVIERNLQRRDQITGRIEGQLALVQEQRSILWVRRKLAAPRQLRETGGHVGTVLPEYPVLVLWSR